MNEIFLAIIVCFKKIRILHKTNAKIDFYYRNIGFVKNMFMTVYMHSVLGLASFCMHYFISVVWHGANPLVALLR